MFCSKQLLMTINSHVLPLVGIGPHYKEEAKLMNLGHSSLHSRCPHCVTLIINPRQQKDALADIT